MIGVVFLVDLRIWIDPWPQWFYQLNLGLGLLPTTTVLLELLEGRCSNQRLIAKPPFHTDPLWPPGESAFSPYYSTSHHCWFPISGKGVVFQPKKVKVWLLWMFCQCQGLLLTNGNQARGLRGMGCTRVGPTRFLAGKPILTKCLEIVLTQFEICKSLF